MDRWVRAYTVNNSALAGKMPRTLNTLGRAMMPAPMTAAKQATKVCQGAQERRRSHFPRRRLRRTRVAEVRHRRRRGSPGSVCHLVGVEPGAGVLRWRLVGGSCLEESLPPAICGGGRLLDAFGSGRLLRGGARQQRMLQVSHRSCEGSVEALRFLLRNFRHRHKHAPRLFSCAKPQDAMTLSCSGPHECCIASRSASWCRTGGPLCGGALAAAALDSRRQWTQQQQTVAVTRSGLLAVSRLRAPPGGS